MRRTPRPHLARLSRTVTGAESAHTAETAAAGRSIVFGERVACSLYDEGGRRRAEKGEPHGERALRGRTDSSMRRFPTNPADGDDCLIRQA